MFGSSNSNMIVNAIKSLERQICCLRNEISGGGESPIIVDNDLGDGSVELIGDGTTDNPLYASATVPIGDNPTASVGLTAVDGIATTFMRSDAAPTISQAIAPTWTATHIFNFTSTAAAPTLQIGGSNPQLDMLSSGAAVDNKRWNMTVGADTFAIRTLNDIGGGANNAIVLTRSGTSITQQDFSTASTIRLTIANTGRVGLGTQAPVGKLHVATGISAITSSGPNNGMLLTTNGNFCRFYMENIVAPTGQRVFALDNAGGVFSLSSYDNTANATTQANIFSATTAGAIAMSSLVGTGVRAVVAAADGTLSTIDNFAVGTATLAFPSTLAGESSDLTIAVTTAAIGYTVIVTPVTVALNVANSCYTAFISAPGVVTVRFNNYSAAPIAPSSGDFKVVVFKY